MAKDANDNVTYEMFTEQERNVMMQALQSHIKTLKRQTNNEPNEAIKLIREAETKKFINIMNKVQGLLP